MKKIFLALVILLVLVVAAVGIFLATFDANRFKPALIQNLEKTLGQPVSMGSIGLTWQKGIALEMKDFVVYRDSAKALPPGLRIKSLSAQVDILALLQKKVQVSSIAIKSPHIEIHRLKDGRVLVGGIDLNKVTAAGFKTSQATNGVGAGEAFALSVDSITLSDGSALYLDESAVQPMKIETKKIDVKVSHFSLDKSFNVTFLAAVFSEQSNIQAKADVSLPKASGVLQLSNVSFKTDLSVLDFKKVIEIFPVLATSGVSGPLSGQVSVTFEKIEPSEAVLRTLSGMIDVKGAGFTVASLGKIDHIDATVGIQKGVADLDAKLRAFSSDQNILVSGKINLPTAQSQISLKDFTLKSDLSDLDLSQVSKAFPAIASSGLKEGLAGNLSVYLQRFAFDEASQATNKGSVEFKNGRVALATLDKPIDRIDLKADVSGREIVLDHLSADVIGGQLTVRGKAIDYLTTPQFYLNGSVRDLPLVDIVKNINPQAPSLQGHLTIEFEGDAKSFMWEGISHTLNGRARILMNDGVLLNYNIVREIIQKLSVIPGAEQAFQNNLPQLYKMKMQENSTILKPIDLQATIQNGVLHFDPLILSTDFVTIYGVGDFGLDRRVAAKASLILSGEISQTLIGVINPLQILANPQGEILIPVTIEGELPQVKILPDKEYITSKLLAGKTTELVEGLVTDPKKALDGFKDIFKKSTQAITS